MSWGATSCMNRVMERARRVVTLVDGKVADNDVREPPSPNGKGA